MDVPRAWQHVEYALPAHLYLVGRAARPRLFVLDRRPPWSRVRGGPAQQLPSPRARRLLLLGGEARRPSAAGAYRVG
jgi:hypothetical protein